MTIINYAINVATQLQSGGQLEQAEIILKNLLEAYPSHAEALHLSGIIAYQRGHINLGIELIEKAISSNSSRALFHSNLGEMHRQLKALDLSIQSGERAVALDPHSDSAWSNLGIAYYDAKQYEQAEICHKRALAINPNLSASLNNLGSLCKIFKKIPEAIQFYKAAIQGSANFIEPLNNLATVLLEQREFKEALAYLNQAIKIGPAFPEIYCNMGLALLGLHQVADARLHFQYALQLKPNYAEAYYGMAKLHLQSHAFAEAENAIRQAIAYSQEVEFYHLLAKIYQEQGKNLKALNFLDQALEMDSTLSTLYLSKGSLLMEIGEISRAEEQFLKVAEDPHVDTRLLAHYSLAQLRKIRSDSLSFKALLSIANNIQQVSPGKLEYIYFALGKCYEDMGEWAKAFAYFTQGCELKRQRISYHINEHLEFAQELIHCFTPETLEHLRSFAHSSALPIFIVGMPRSGTTLVEQILACHPDVYGAGELSYFTDFIRSSEGNATYPENIRSPINWNLIAEKYLSHLREISSDAIRITDKMPQNFVAVGLIHALFPKAKIIHVKRNPIDTCVSCYTKLFTEGHFYSYDLSELGQYYRCYESIMQHWRLILPSDALLEIHYEDIIENLEPTAKKLLEYCNLSWDPACLTFYQSKRQVRTASFMQVRQPVYTSSLNRWRRFENELAPLIKILN